MPRRYNNTSKGQVAWVKGWTLSNVLEIWANNEVITKSDSVTLSVRWLQGCWNPVPRVVVSIDTLLTFGYLFKSVKVHRSDSIVSTNHQHQPTSTSYFTFIITTRQVQSGRCFPSSPAPFRIHGRPQSSCPSSLGVRPTCRDRNQHGSHGRSHGVLIFISASQLLNLLILLISLEN